MNLNSEPEDFMKRTVLAAIAATCIGIAPGLAQTGTKMTNDQLVQLTANGIVLKLGGKGEGYAGKLTLRKDGTGKGSAKTDAGDTISISGTWTIRDGKFCRTWAKLNDGKELCETWYLSSPNSAEVFDGKRRIGVNAW
jgi:hypothetical protein